MIKITTYFYQKIKLKKKKVNNEEWVNIFAKFSLRTNPSVICFQKPLFTATCAVLATCNTNTFFFFSPKSSLVSRAGRTLWAQTRTGGSSGAGPPRVSAFQVTGHCGSSSCHTSQGVRAELAGSARTRHWDTSDTFDVFWTHPKPTDKLQALLSVRVGVKPSKATFTSILLKELGLNPGKVTHHCLVLNRTTDLNPVLNHSRLLGSFYTIKSSLCCF